MINKKNQPVTLLIIEGFEAAPVQEAADLLGISSYTMSKEDIHEKAEKYPPQVVVFFNPDIGASTEPEIRELLDKLSKKNAAVEHWAW